MLESCGKWLGPGLGLIKLANPTAGNWLPRPKNERGHSLEVTRTLLGGAQVWHNSDGKWFVRFRDGAKRVGHSCTRGRWKMKQLLRRRGSAVDAAVEQVATRNGWLPASLPAPPLSVSPLPPPPPPAPPRCWTSMRRACWMSSWTGAFASCQLVQQGDLKLVWRWSQGPSCESRRRVLARQKSLRHSCQQL